MPVTPARPEEPSRSLRTAAGTGRGNTWRRDEAPPRGTAGSVLAVPPEQDRTPQCPHPQPPPHRGAGAATAERRRRGPFSSCGRRAAARFHCPGLPRTGCSLPHSLPACPQFPVPPLPPPVPARSAAPLTCSCRARPAPPRHRRARPARGAEQGAGPAESGGGAGPRWDCKDRRAPPANASFIFRCVERGAFWSL